MYISWSRDRLDGNIVMVSGDLERAMRRLKKQVGRYGASKALKRRSLCPSVESRRRSKLRDSIRRRRKAERNQIKRRR